MPGSDHWCLEEQSLSSLGTTEDTRPPESRAVALLKGLNIDTNNTF